MTYLSNTGAKEGNGLAYVRAVNWQLAFVIIVILFLT